MSALHLSVYEPDGTTFIAHIPRRQDVGYLDELNGDGNGKFSISIDDDLLQEKPNLLTAGNVVKVRPTNLGAPAFGWRIEEVAPATVQSSEGAGRAWSVTGRSCLCILETGQVQPETGISVVSSDTRWFGFSSKDGSWRVPADWIAPAAVRWDLTTSARKNSPIDWPDTNTSWIWSSNPDTSAAPGRNWFRATFTLTAPKDITIYATGDNAFSLHLNGEEVMTGDTWRTTYAYSVSLPAGTHTLGAWVDNLALYSGNNPGAFLCVVATVDANGIPLTVLRRTNATEWTVHSYAPPVPGWHTSQILSTLVLESVARNEICGVTITLGYTDSHDAAGVAFDDIQDTSVNVGDDLRSVAATLVELGLDIAMTPEFTLNAWKKRGADLHATVRVLPGRDVVVSTPSVRYSTIRNSLLVRHGQGWVRVEDTASIAEFGRRPTTLAAGDTDSEAQAVQLAHAYFAENAQPQTTLRITMSSTTTGPQPYVDFSMGDIITVPNQDGDLVAARVMSIGPDEQDTYVTYDIDLYLEG